MPTLTPPLTAQTALHRLRVATPWAWVLVLSLADAASAAVIGQNPPAPPVNAERLNVLPIEQRSAWAAHLAASARQMQADRAALQAEREAERAAGRPLPAPPAGGNSAASMPLDQPAAWYASPEALRVADTIVSYQTPAGGWGKNQPRTQPPRLPGQAYVAGNASAFVKAGDFDTTPGAGWSYVGTIDNDATLTEIAFLARVTQQLAGPAAQPYRDSALRGIRYLLAAQYPNGGYPQVWPLQGGYHDAITLNDNAMAGVAQLLGEVVRNVTLYGFVPADLRTAAAAAEQQAIQNLLALQLRVNGRLSIWGQQHDPLTLQPVSARNYEPPALCTSESAEVLRYLMSLPQPSAAVIAAVQAGVAALRELELVDVVWARRPVDAARGLHAEPGARGLWARYVDPQTLKPVFGDRDKTLHDEVSGISVERRNGYAWFVTNPRAVLAAHPAWAQRWVGPRQP